MSFYNDDISKFKESVRDKFQFLETEYGFKYYLLSSNEFRIHIRYESRYIYVNLLYGSPQFEVVMSFGRLGVDDVSDGYSFSDGDLRLLNRCVNWKYISEEQPDKITGAISYFASVLKECGIDCINGEYSSFDEMKIRRDRVVKAWHRDEHNKPIHNKIYAEWGRKNYRKVVELYQLIDGELTEIDKKRLSVAKEKLAKPSDACDKNK